MSDSFNVVDPGTCSSVENGMVKFLKNRDANRPEIKGTVNLIRLSSQSLAASAVDNLNGGRQLCYLTADSTINRTISSRSLAPGYKML